MELVNGDQSINTIYMLLKQAGDTRRLKLFETIVENNKDGLGFEIARDMFVLPNPKYDVEKELKAEISELKARCFAKLKYVSRLVNAGNAAQEKEDAELAAKGPTVSSDQDPAAQKQIEPSQEPSQEKEKEQQQEQPQQQPDSSETVEPPKPIGSEPNDTVQLVHSPTHEVARAPEPTPTKPAPVLPAPKHRTTLKKKPVPKPKRNSISSTNKPKSPARARRNSLEQKQKHQQQQPEAQPLKAPATPKKVQKKPNQKRKAIHESSDTDVDEPEAPKRKSRRSTSQISFQEPDSELELDEEVWCPCGKPDPLDMIGCEDSNCKHQWFHMKCVKLRPERLPEHWMCKDCLKRQGITLKKYQGMRKREEQK